MNSRIRSLFWQRILAFDCALLVLLCPARAAGPETTKAYASNGELDYIGDLDDAANQRLFDLYETLSPKPRVLSIRSEGGEVNAGMSLGAWVRDHRLDVKVLEYCLSSCANYVFPAGIRKIVSNVAVIGYHGGPNNPGKLALGAEAREVYNALSPAKRKAFMDDIAATSLRDSRRESDYFRRIGVRADISSLGQQPEYARFAAANPGTAGWTYSLEGFALLGVRDISVIDPPWKPGSTSRHPVFVTIPVKARAAGTRPR